MRSNLPQAAVAVGAAIAGGFAWGWGAAAAVFGFLGSGLLLGVLHGQAGSSVATLDEADWGATSEGRENSGLDVGVGLLVYALGGFCLGSVLALAVFVAA